MNKKVQDKRNMVLFLLNMSEKLKKVLMYALPHHTSHKRESTQGIHPGFETQGRRHQKSKTGVAVAPRKGLMSSKDLFKKNVSPHNIRFEGHTFCIGDATINVTSPSVPKV